MSFKVKMIDEINIFFYADHLLCIKFDLICVSSPFSVYEFIPRHLCWVTSDCLNSSRVVVPIVKLLIIELKAFIEYSFFQIYNKTFLKKVLKKQIVLKESIIWLDAH